MLVFSVCQARYKSYTRRYIHINYIFNIIPDQCLPRPPL